MAMATLKQVFMTRKSNRLSLRRSKSKGKEAEDMEDNQAESKLLSKDSSVKFSSAENVGEDRISPKCEIEVTKSLLRQDSQTFQNAAYRVNESSSGSSLSSGNVCRTPPRDDSLCAYSDSRKACRNLMSSSSSNGSNNSAGKRKSDEENDPGLSSTSPVKSPRKTPKSKLAGEDQITPKSIRKPFRGERRASASSTPRRLFPSSENKSVPSTPDATSTPSRAFSKLKLASPGQTKLQRPDAKPYQAAKHALHTAKPERLIGRDKEEEELEEFLTDKLEQKSSSSVYISGPPGTGKTAVVSHLVDRLKCHYNKLKTSVINCMMLRDSHSVFSHLHKELTGQPLKVKDSAKAMERLVTTSKDSILIVLDEIDQLDSKHQEILYQIFEWPSLPHSKVILIGIANALDLTDRILPRLQAAVKCKPVLMNFAPYTSSQITDILRNRLERETVVEPGAMLFCAKKVASVAGDVRKALDVCRRAVEMVEADVRSQNVLKLNDCNSPSKQNHSTIVKTVNITHISKVMANIYGSSVSSATNGGDSDIPLQQKLAVCSLLLLIKSSKCKEVSLGKLYDTYIKVCRGQQTATVDQSEFHSVLGLLEARGVTSLKKAKDTRLIKVSLKLDEQELEQTLKDKRLMDAILSSGLK